ncbi:TraB/GumN family protein [Flaviaesturariibacter flavus]|uniref:TraB/GumN family protein n=1 Tax=Flaviaesturariibacter flavus TaxID=2502780 RepID=A0A4R1BNM9_9BACT|nr:TraB/GumN family protein [Flaviaesturariibacter flavus]TCJ18957.1 TraB/GumN family protein [Flaviaesturariibacter flavus]
MKNIFLALLLLVGVGSVSAQKRAAQKTPALQKVSAAQKIPAVDENTLLWRISGNGLQQPSYLFGTMHLLCAQQIDLSDSLRAAIASTSQVYLELDMENVQELSGVMGRMKMNGDTTLADLLPRPQYDSVRSFFSDKDNMIPFAMLEKFKPMLAASALMEADMDCPNPISMEQLIMAEAKEQGRDIKGLETMSFQMSIFDSIPYALQARQLIDYVRNYGKGDSRKEFEEMMQAYLLQRLDKLEGITRRDGAGMDSYNDLLLFRRNANWVQQLQRLMPESSVLVAVGAGHLPGDKGLIRLLRAAGYTVEPVANNMLRKMEKTL